MITGWRSIDHKGIAYVHAAHIIPESINTNIDENEKKVCVNVSLFLSTQNTP